LTRDDVLAELRGISVTSAHNVVGPGSASWRKVLMVLSQTFEHVVCLHWHTGALPLQFFTARRRASVSP
jgi:hypothetical protein